MLRYSLTFYLRDVCEPQVVWSTVWDDVEDLETFVTFRGWADENGRDFLFLSFEPGSVICVRQREYADADNVPVNVLPAGA